MINPDFYPTPKKIIHKMVDPYSWTDRCILEPSAGKGDILDYLTDTRYGKRTLKTAAIENDPELQATLRGKGYQLVGDDFLSFRPSNMYDLIVMNPPFRNGVDHLLHAWEILRDGDIVCLLNAETVNNPYTEKRKLLKNIIEQHGTVEMIGPVFQDAERKTGVETALIRLHKDGDLSMFDFHEETKERTVNMLTEQQYELTSPDAIQAAVDTYEAAKIAFVEIWKARRKVEAYTYGLLDAQNIIDTALSKSTPVQGFNHFVTEIRAAFWNKLFQGSDFSSRMTSSIKEEFHRFCQQNNGMEFTPENISRMLGDLIMSSSAISQQCVVDVFDKFTKYYKENRVHIEGWKSNNQWQANRKIILPYMVEIDWGGNFKVKYGMYSNGEELASDIDKAMCFLTNKKYDQIKTIQAAVKEGNHDKHGFSEFFELRWYKKETLHLTFLDEALWKRFNITACKGKNWLPDEGGM